MRKLSFQALLGFAFSIPIEDSVQFGIGRLSKIFGLLAVMTWVLALASGSRLRRVPAALRAAAAFVAWELVSYFWSAVPSASLTKAGTLLQMLLVVWILWDQTSTARELVDLFRAFVLGAFAASMLTFVAAGTGQAFKGVRYASSNAGPDNTGALLAIAVCMACYLWRVDRDPRWRTLYAAFLPIAGVAILLTATRTAAVSVMLGLAVVVFDRRYLSLRRLVALGAVGLAVAVLAVRYVPSRSVERLGTTGNEITSGTLNGRTYYWHLAFQFFSDHPVQGVGAGAFALENTQVGGQGRPAHNVFMSVLAETGVVGLSLFLIALALAASGLRHERPDLRRAWVAIWITWLVGASSLTWEVRKITWFVFALSLVQARLTLAARREAVIAAAEAPAIPEEASAAR